MFLWMWQFVRGYVMLEAVGAFVERFMNMAAHKGIYLWDVSYIQTGVRLKVSIDGFRMLHDCARKTKTCLHIVDKKGAPFLLYRYRRRKVLAIGFLLSIALLYSLSLFIWMIDIHGYDRVSREALLEFCQQQGLQIGAFKYKIDNKKLKTELLNRFSEISWIDIHTKGTRTSIEIVETIPRAVVVDTSEPCDIVAAKDGLITSIVTGAGTPLVKRNDVVRKGDVLVSGVLKTAGDDIIMEKTVRAYAEVWARMYHEIKLTVPFRYEEKAYTGKHMKQYAIMIFGRVFQPFPTKDLFQNYEKTTARTQFNFGEDYPLPIILMTDTYREFEPMTITRTVPEANELAQKMVNARIIHEFDFGADIMDKSVATQETPNGLEVQALITTNERIDQAQPIHAAVSQ